MKCKNCRNLFKRRDDDGTIYDWCRMIVDCPDRDLDRDCKYYQHASNADKIRAMSDEELADFMTDDFCELLCKSPTVCDGQCSLKLLQWLKQEAVE